MYISNVKFLLKTLISKILIVNIYRYYSKTSKNLYSVLQFFDKLKKLNNKANFS